MNTVEYETFICSGEEPELTAGQPIIFRHPDVVVEASATTFLMDRYVRAGNRPSPHTWRSAADAITSWLNYCEAACIAVESADEDDLRAYRDEYLNTVSPRGAPYSPKTVAMRIGYIQEYCQYLSERSLHHGDIAAPESHERCGPARVDENPLAHLGRNQRELSNARIRPKLTRSEPIKPAVPADLRILMDWAARSYAPQRNSLILKVGWVCGLRKDEALSLTAPQFRGIATDPQSPNLPYSIRVPGKGRKARNVAVPAWLIDEANAYAEEERAHAIARARSRRDPGRLFVGTSESKTPGKPITPSAIDALMQRACMGSGLIETASYQDPETSAIRLISRARYSYHALRHTYACLTYQLEKLEGNPEPWKKIQANLGHANLKTTVDTYLSWVQLFAPTGRNTPDYRSVL